MILACLLSAGALSGCSSEGEGGSSGGSSGAGTGGALAGSGPKASSGGSASGAGGSAGAGSGGGGAAGKGGSAGTSGGAAGSAGTNAGVGGTGGNAGGGAGGAGAGGTGDAGSAGIAGAGSGGLGANGGSGGSSGSAGSAGTGGTAGALECPPAATLKEAADCTGRLIGAALAASHLSESGYATAAREHNYATAENEMKWGSIQPQRGQFNFGPADQIVNFAMQNGMKVKGHTLVWFDQNPSWVTSISNANELRTAMADHIEGVMDHYKGKITEWDVVNEAWVTPGRTGDGTPTLRDSVFSRLLGESFIDEAFIAARAADPDATLIYNDFANEGLSDKSDHIYEMVKDMKMRDIPIDGVGMQMHVGVNTAPSVADVTANMQRLAELGLKIYVSEMDVNGCAGYDADEQRAWYHDMVAVCVAQPACVAFTIWGITDKYSWLNGSQDDSMCSGGQSPRPLLWDDNYGKKPTYTGVLEALLGE